MANTSTTYTADELRMQITCFRQRATAIEVDFPADKRKPAMQAELTMLNTMAAKAWAMLQEQYADIPDAAGIKSIELKLGAPYRILREGHRLDGQRVILDTIMPLHTGKVMVISGIHELCQVPTDALVVCQ